MEPMEGIIEGTMPDIESTAVSPASSTPSSPRNRLWRIQSTDDESNDNDNDRPTIIIIDDEIRKKAMCTTERWPPSDEGRLRATVFMGEHDVPSWPDELVNEVNKMECPDQLGQVDNVWVVGFGVLKDVILDSQFAYAVHPRTHVRRMLTPLHVQNMLEDKHLGLKTPGEILLYAVLNLCCADKGLCQHAPGMATTNIAWRTLKVVDAPLRESLKAAMVKYGVAPHLHDVQDTSITETITDEDDLYLGIAIVLRDTLDEAMRRDHEDRLKEDPQLSGFKLHTFIGKMLTIRAVKEAEAVLRKRGQTAPATRAEAQQSRILEVVEQLTARIAIGEKETEGKIEEVDDQQTNGVTNSVGSSTDGTESDDKAEDMDGPQRKNSAGSTASSTDETEPEGNAEDMHVPERKESGESTVSSTDETEPEEKTGDINVPQRKNNARSIVSSTDETESIRTESIEQEKERTCTKCRKTFMYDHTYTADCPRCDSATYCSSTCRRTHRSAHKKKCDRIYARIQAAAAEAEKKAAEKRANRGDSSDGSSSSETEEDPDIGILNNVPVIIYYNTISRMDPKAILISNQLGIKIPGADEEIPTEYILRALITSARDTKENLETFLGPNWRADRSPLHILENPANFYRVLRLQYLLPMNSGAKANDLLMHFRRYGDSPRPATRVEEQDLVEVKKKQIRLYALMYQKHGGPAKLSIEEIESLFGERRKWKMGKSIQIAVALDTMDLGMKK